MSKPELREKQVEQLAFYIKNPKCLDQSHPGTGKTPPACVYSYWHWSRNGKKTLWTMPKSLLKKNKKEMLRFTDYKPEDVVILTTDRADLTKNWEGPTIVADRKRSGWEVIYEGETTTTMDLRDKVDGPAQFVYVDKDGKRQYLGRQVKEGHTFRVTPILGPDGTPRRATVTEQKIFKDLIKANSEAKVFITTFKFAANHWKRLLEAAAEIDLFLVDELHMPGGYSTPDSQSTESFFWINKHCSRYLGMTGTLINGRLDSAYASISAIEPRYYGSLQGFYAQHAAVIDDYGRVIVWKNEPHLKKILEKHSIQRTFEEVYGKEPVAFYTEFVDVEEDIRQHYDKFHDEAMLELENGEILDGTMAGVAITRARQILNHPETMFKTKSKWTPRDERIRIHLSEGKKTLIFASQKPEQRRLLELAQEMGLRAALINSDVSGPQRAKIDEMAQEGKLDVIVASGPTAAVGYNWEMFDLVLFASVDFMDTNVIQAYRRASRGTRTTELRVIYIRYRDTVERRIYAILTAKSKLANAVDSSRPVLEFAEEE